MNFEINFNAVTFADPIFLHANNAVRPILQTLQIL